MMKLLIILICLMFTISNAQIESPNNDCKGADSLVFKSQLKYFQLNSIINDCKEIKYLNLFAQGLDSLPINIKYLNNLTYLDIGGNNIQDIPKWLCELKELKQVNLSYNQKLNFNKTMQTLSNCGKLEDLKLSGNNLKEIPENIDLLINLRNLDLAKNNLNKLDTSVSKLKNLREIILDNNVNIVIENTINVLSEVPKLETLSFYNNEIKFLPQNISLLINLKKLILDFNYLNSIPKEVYKLKKLEHLGLAGNKLDHLPSGISTLNNLKILVLTGNNLNNEELKSIRDDLPNCKVFY